MESTISFGAWLKQRHRAIGFTRDDLARLVGCAAATIRKLEADERRPAGAGTTGVRLALYTGALAVRGGVYAGHALDRAARLLEVAHSGQVLLSRDLGIEL